jgi:hypothetical protein
MGKVAVKIILKKNVKGNEQMVYDELQMLQRMKHPHIVRFVDWFESRVRYFIWPHYEENGLTYARTNTTLSHSWLQEESYSTESVSVGDSQKKMPRRPCDRSLRR